MLLIDPRGVWEILAGALVIAVVFVRIMMP
jgi:hypothetical protein